MAGDYSTFESLPPAEGNCFGYICLQARQQVMFWTIVGVMTAVIVYRGHRRAQAKLKPKSKKQKVDKKNRVATEVTASLLENGHGNGDDLSQPVRVSSAKMNNVCNDVALKNGLEAASLAVLSVFVNRRNHSSPSIGVISGKTPITVDVEPSEEPMSFAALLKETDKALSLARTQPPTEGAAPPEVVLAWECKSLSSAQWALMRDENSHIVVTGGSRSEENSFKILFEACASNPDVDVWQVPLYSESTVKQVATWGAALKDFRRYRDPSGRLIPVPKLLVNTSADMMAQAVAGQDFNMSYQVLWQAVSSVASEVKRKLQGKEKQFVVLYMGRGKMLAPSFLGILQAGCTVVPVDVHWPGERAKGVAIDAGSSLVLTDAASSQSWADLDAGLPTLEIDDAILTGTADGTSSVEAIDQDDAAVVLFTSGSTGKPKGIVLSHGYLTALTVGVGETKEMTRDTRTLSYHSPTWMPFLDYLIAPLLQGGSCLFYPEGSSHVVRPNELNAFAWEKKATLIGLVPAVLDIFLEQGLPPSLHAVGVGGAAVTAELCLRVASTLLKSNTGGFLLTTGYSGTEQGDVTNIRMRSLLDVEEAACDKPIMGAGRPHAGQTHVLVDRNGNFVGSGAVGEVMVTGPGLASGYLNLPQQTSEYFINCKALGGARSARTGDLARWTEEGHLELVGRLGSMVKVRGARVDLGEVEVAIGAHPDVKACVVTVHDDKLVAYVEPAVPGDLRDTCQARLVAYMVPHIFEGLDELPRLANGKVNKKALKPPAPREDGAETVMELDSLGQMRKFSRKNAAEDVVLDNVRAILIGVVIQSHAIPMVAGKLGIIHRGQDHGKLEDLHADWAPWQFWLLYLMRSGGWSSLAFLSGYDDTRAEHKGYGLTYREVLFVVIWIMCNFNWTMWYLPAFVYMRIAFVAWAKVGLEKTHILLASQLWILFPAFVDLYIGWTPPFEGQETDCTCFCPFETFPWAQKWSYYLYGYWNSGMMNSYLGHGLIFVPCYWIGLYSGKHIFPYLCQLSTEKNWLRRIGVSIAVLVIYLLMYSQLDAMKEAYDDRCSSFWNHGSFVWLQVLKNIRYFAVNLSMSLLYVIVIAAMVPVHLKYLAKICFSSLLFSPFAVCVLDLPEQALVLRQVLPSIISPVAEITWLMTVPFLFELVSGAAFAVILPVIFKGVMSAWARIVK